MKIASVADVKARFSAFLRESKRSPVSVTVDDGDEIERLILAYSPKFQKMLNLARRQIREGRGIQHEDFWRQAKDNKV